MAKKKDLLERAKAQLAAMVEETIGSLLASFQPPAPSPPPPPPARPPRPTGSLQRRGTGPLQAARGTAPLKAPQTAPLPPPEDPGLKSRQRLAFILGYLRDPQSDPIYANRTQVYQVLMAEHAYLGDLVKGLKARLDKLPAAEQPAAERTIYKFEGRMTRLMIMARDLTASA